MGGRRRLASSLLPPRGVPGPRRRAVALAFATFAALLVPAAPTPAADASLTAALDQQVRRARQKVPDLGVAVVELAEGVPVYRSAADRLLVPASNQKLLTTAAALHHLGPGYVFETPLGLRGEVVGDTLTGDLAVRGSGDPTISGRFEAGDPYATFRRWASALLGRGIRRVTGDVYLEHGLFGGPQIHPDWPRDSLMWWYGAPVSALSFNDNCILLRAWGGARAGGPAVADLVPQLPLLSIDNGLVTTARRSEHDWKVHRDPFSAVLEVDGRVFQRARPFEVWVTVPDPVSYFGAALHDAFAQEGIEIEGGEVAVERLPGPWWQVVAVEESGLLEVLDVTNKRSQNFYAESLFKLLGARLCRRGDWQGGAEALREFGEQHLGWAPGSFEVSDGSGMSRGNRLSADQIAGLLAAMFRHRWGVEFLRSLAFSGEEGTTMHERLDEPPYRGNVAAKTGTLAGVSTLSGYVKARSGRLYAFSILCNRASAWEGRQAQDGILEALVDRG